MANLFNTSVGLYRYNSAAVVPINTVMLDLDLGELIQQIPNSTIAVQCSAMGTSGVASVQFSNLDGAGYTAVSGDQITSNATVAGSITGTGLFVYPVAGRFMRLIMTTATTSGTTTFTVASASGAGFRPVIVSNSPSVAMVAPSTAVDVSSAAITATTTGSATATGSGNGYQINYRVTAVSGTSPTLDLRIEETFDGGNSWVGVYDFPRITAAGSYNSPVLPNRSAQYRLVQTVGGTTPSFTREIRRNQVQFATQAICQLIDRSVALNTLNATTPALDTTDMGNQVKVTFNTGAGATTAPQLQLEGSDDAGATWVAIGSPITAVASASVSASFAAQSWQRLRGRISTAGVGATMGYVMIRAHD